MYLQQAVVVHMYPAAASTVPRTTPAAAYSGLQPRIPFQRSPLQHVAQPQRHHCLMHAIPPAFMLRMLPPGCHACCQQLPACKAISCVLCLPPPPPQGNLGLPLPQQPPTAQHAAGLTQPVCCLCCVHFPGMQHGSRLLAAPAVVGHQQRDTRGTSLLLQQAQRTVQQALPVEARRCLLHCSRQTARKAV